MDALFAIIQINGTLPYDGQKLDCACLTKDDLITS